METFSYLRILYFLWTLSVFWILYLPGSGQTASYLLSKADSSFEKGDFISASEYYNTITDKFPFICDAKKKLSESYRLSHNYDDAIASYQDFFNTCPEDSSIHRLNNVELLILKGNYKEAQRELRYFQNNWDIQYNKHKEQVKAMLKICDYAINNSNQKKRYIIEKFSLDNSLSYYSPVSYPDSTLFYSNISRDNPFEAKLSVQNPSKKQFINLIETINKIRGNVSDIAVNPKGDSAIFMQCQYGKNITCTPFYTKLLNGKWTIPKKMINDTLNIKQILPTFHDSIQDFYFAADHIGGKGGMDIWHAHYFNHDSISISNMGPQINTLGNEICPFFNSKDSLLFFSSDFHTGYGGYDIFKVSLKKKEAFHTPNNLGPGINTSFNELYYKGNIFTSNRDTTIIGQQTYHLNKIFIAHKIDSTTPIKYESFHINVYFNKSRPSKTDLLSRDSLSYKYQLQILTQGDGNKSISNSYNELIESIEKTLIKLHKGRKTTIKISGHFSPEGNRIQNIKLAKRREESVKTFLLNYKNKALCKFIDNGTLQIINNANIKTSTMTNGKSFDKQRYCRIDFIFE